MQKLLVTVFTLFYAYINCQYISPDEYKYKTLWRDCFDTGAESVYDYSFETIDGKRNVSLGEYRNVTLLIVNVATYCGFTYTYPQLNELKQIFANNSFEILAFPCNQFGQQEPGGSREEILNGIMYVRPGNGFVPQFPMSKKIDVNGDKQSPLYSYLKRSCPTTSKDFAKRERLYYDPLNERDIRWNFEKFLVHPATGKPIKRYSAYYDPISIEQDILEIVQKFPDTSSAAVPLINDTTISGTINETSTETTNLPEETIL